jgi:hypothetical protein
MVFPLWRSIPETRCDRNPGTGKKSGTDETFLSFCATAGERWFPVGPGSDSWLCDMADGCDSSFALLGLVRLRLFYPRLAPWAVLCRHFAAILCPRFAAILRRRFAAIHGRL